MKAVQYNASIPRYALGMMLKNIYPGILWNGLSCTYMANIPEPQLPGPEWVKIRTRYGGICGTDLGNIALHTSPYFTPYSSFPFTIGHENVGTIVETGAVSSDWQVGERVVSEPVLWCQPRGFQDLCPYCARGEINRCERFRSGDLAPGLMTGSCRDTSGSWSPFFLAHRSQVYKIPDSVSDENALMVEPFAVGLHAALLSFPTDDQQVLILGAGTIGLCTLAALRSLGSQAKIVISARYLHQAKAAERLGASEVIHTKGTDLFSAAAQIFTGEILKPIIGKRVFAGGADLVFECVGSDSSIDNALRLARIGGEVVLVGLPGIARGIDWTAILAQELTLQASFYYNHAEKFQGKVWKTFDLAIHLMATGQIDLGWMVTHQFRLEEYKNALQAHRHRSQAEVLKAVFEFPQQR